MVFLCWDDLRSQNAGLSIRSNPSFILLLKIFWLNFTKSVIKIEWIFCPTDLTLKKIRVFSRKDNFSWEKKTAAKIILFKSLMWFLRKKLLHNLAATLNCSWSTQLLIGMEKILRQTLEFVRSTDPRFDRLPMSRGRRERYPFHRRLQDLSTPSCPWTVPFRSLAEQVTYCVFLVQLVIMDVQFMNLHTITNK